MKKILLIIFLFLFISKASALEASYQDAVNFYEAGEYKRALKVVDKLEVQGELNAQTCLLRYELYKNINKLKEAKEALFMAIKYDEDCYEAYIALAGLALENSNPNEAKKYFKEAININPEISESPDILYYYAKICILDKDYDSALKYILSAIELRGDENLYYLELGKIYLQKGEYLRAVNALEYSIGGDEEINSEAYNYIGVSNYKRGNFKQAINYFQKASSIKNSIIYLNNLAMSYKTVSDEKNYEETVLKIVNMEPQSPLEFLELSQVLYSRKNYDGAKKALIKGLELYPDNLLLKGAFSKLNKT